MAKAEKKDDQPIEATLSNLEAILLRMESEEQPLEASLADFEEGIRLTRQAQRMLREAEQKVQLLTENGNGEPQAAPLTDVGDIDDEQ